MLRNVILLVLGLATMLVLGCNNQAISRDKKLVVYAPVEPVLAESVKQAFAQAHPEIKLELVYKQEGQAQSDVILAGEEQLRDYKAKGQLLCLEARQEEALWGDKDGYWQNFFYDPAVLLINQSFARQVGQRHLRSWSDVERLERGRLVVENLTNSSSTLNFLGSWASRYGEAETIQDLKAMDQRVEQYVQLPFTPVRMVAVGDADIAITRQSYLAKYLESSFPAYVVLPAEGTPVDLYGLAIFSQCRELAAAKTFLTWLQQDAYQALNARGQETGYSFLTKTADQAVTPELLWQNSEYLNLEQIQELSEQWLQSVRFGVRS